MPDSASVTRKKSNPFLPEVFIAGIQVIPLEDHVDERGFFREVCLASKTKIVIRQVSLSKTKPGVIKAFHWHEKQFDAWHLVSGTVLVGLHDLRKDSVSFGKTDRFVWSADEKPLLLVIPKKVAHGYKVLGDKPAVMLYLMDKEYDAKKPDEKRIPFDSPDIGFDWQIMGE